MCMIGAATKRIVVPRSKAITAIKRVSDHYTYDDKGKKIHEYHATSFTGTLFKENGKKMVNKYRRGQTYSTVAPTIGRNLASGFENYRTGNERGFWCWKPGQAASRDMGTTAMTVKIWGVVIEHERGWRSQFLKVIAIKKRG